MLIGWIAVAIGAGYFIFYQAMVEPNQPGHHFGEGDRIELAIGFLLTVIGLGAAAFGEIVGVLFAIEENTRKTANK